MSHARNRLLMRVAAPASEPVTLTEAKTYLRVDAAAEDVLIADLITAARMTAEDWMKRSLISQSWKLAYDDCLEECVSLPMGPVSAVTSVTAVNRDGGTLAISADGYYLSADKTQLMLDSPVFAFRVEVIYATGYGNAAAVPRPIKQGLLAHIAALYDCRGDAGNMAFPAQAARLYMPYREALL